VTFLILDFGGSVRLEDLLEELEESDIEIFDASERKVYDNSVYSDPKYALIWLWREFILCAIEHHRSDRFNRELIENVKQFGIAAEVLERLDQEVSGR
jgi:hypothetical protein